MRRAEQFAVGHARKKNVVGEACLTGHFGAGVDAPPRNADDPKILAIRGGSCWLLWRFLPIRHDASLGRSALLRDLQHRGFYGFENLQVASAAAEISRKRFTDLAAIRVRIRVQQSLCRYKDSRRAVAALCRAKIRKRILQRVKPPILAKPFDRQDFPACAFKRQD